MYSYFYGFYPCYFKIKDGFTRKLLRLACLPIPPHPHILVAGVTLRVYGYLPFTQPPHPHIPTDLIKNVQCSCLARKNLD